MDFAGEINIPNHIEPVAAESIAMMGLIDINFNFSLGLKTALPATIDLVEELCR